MSVGKTNRTMTQFAAKKLLGKAHTDNTKSDVNESIPSNVSLPHTTIFAGDIPNTPHTNFYTISGSVEKVMFEVVALSNTIYDANDTDGGGDEASANGAHGYYLKLPSNYQTTSSNPQKGAGSFTNGKRVYNTRGRLQLVPPLVSNASPNHYYLKLYSGAINPADEDVNKIDDGHAIDWQIDYYSGVVFIQDYDASKVPVSASGYLYVGDFLDEKLDEISSSAGSGNVSYGRTVVAGTLTSSVSDKILGVSATASLEIRLPAASGFSNGQYFTIKDEAGNANSNNITILTTGGDTIDGGSSIILESPHAAVNLYCDGSSKFFIY